MKFKTPTVNAPPPAVMSPQPSTPPAGKDGADVHAPDHDAMPVNAPPATARRFARRGNAGTLLWFTRQFYLLIASGMQIIDALESLCRQASDERWQSILRQISLKVEEGKPLSEALEAYPTHFDSVYCSLVAAGESSGQLKEMLQRLAVLTQQQLQVRRAVIGALIYPSLLLSAATSALVVIVVVVLPRFTELFASMKLPLPPSTKLLMTVSELARSNWPIVLGGIVAFVVGMYFMFTTTGGRRIVDGVVLNTPKFGQVVKNFSTARIARLLGILTTSKVPLLNSLELVRRSMTNSRYAEMIAKAEDSVSRGEPISAAFADSKLVNASIYEAVRSGEQSGRVGELLLDVADFLDEENQTTVRTLTSILEPVILIILGLMVGFVAVSLFLPLFDLAAAA